MRKEITTYGVITNGNPHVTRRADFIKAILNHYKDGERFMWVVKPIFVKRSNALNAYYWGVIIDCFISGEEATNGHEMCWEYINRMTGEILQFPMELSEKQKYAHDMLKKMFNNNISTTQNTNSQQMEYNEYCRNYIKFCYNIQVPLPNENLQLF